MNPMAVCKEPRNASEESSKQQSQTAGSRTEPAINSTHPLCFADNFSINLTIHTTYLHDMTERNQIYPSQVSKFVIRCGKKRKKKKSFNICQQIPSYLTNITIKYPYIEWSLSPWNSNCRTIALIFTKCSLAS